MAGFEKYRIPPEGGFKIAKLDADDRSCFKDGKEKAQERILKLRAELAELQEVLYAEGKQRLLVVIQAMDTGGKDGTIRAVFEGVNPQGVKVASFKAPTPLELAHDYLWRVHERVPAKGEIVVFNRSHYEDVLIVRVKGWIDAAETKRRYRQIRDFERMLAEEGTTIRKFYLHISKEEQKERLLERIDLSEKQWKFNPGDLEERKLWEDYQRAFEDALNETSSKEAPWYAVPANRNWYRNLAVLSILVDALKGLKMEYPKQTEDLAPYRQRLLEE